MYKAYAIIIMATPVNKKASNRLTLSPKFNNPIPKEPKMIVKLSQLRNVRSLAKKTLGSTLVGKAILLPGVVWRSGADDMWLVEVAWILVFYLRCQMG